MRQTRFDHLRRLRRQRELRGPGRVNVSLGDDRGRIGTAPARHQTFRPVDAVRGPFTFLKFHARENGEQLLAGAANECPIVECDAIFRELSADLPDRPTLGNRYRW